MTPDSASTPPTPPVSGRAPPEAPRGRPGDSGGGRRSEVGHGPNGGTWNDLDIGHSIYTFGTALPASYDKTVTTTLGIYATRNMISAGIQDKNYFYDVEQDFVPNGSTPTRSGTSSRTPPATLATTRCPRTAVRATT